MRAIDAVIGHADVGNRHVHKQNERNEPRRDASGEEDSADEFNQSTAQRRGSRCRQM